MRLMKSQPKLKFSLNKYENFFSQKNLEDPMFMDDKSPDHFQMTNKMLSYSSMTIQPRAKLSYSLNEKVSAVLSDSRKMGMIEKVQNQSTRKSLAKLSSVSALPPIKTQTQQIEQHLRKIKFQLNQVSLKSIKLSKEASNIQATINQTRQKSRVLSQILSKTGKKQQEQIITKKQITQQIKYNFAVRNHMKQTLKSDLRTLAKQKHNLQQKYKISNIQLNSLQIQLDNMMLNINSNIYTQKQFKQKQQLTSEEVMAKSQAAQNKLIHQQNAQKINLKLSLLEKYQQNKYRNQTNLQNHKNSLKQLRVQQVLKRIMDNLHHKYQTHWLEYEKAENLMKMYIVLNAGNNNKSQINRNSSNLKSTINNRSLVKNKSVISVVSVKDADEQIDLDFVYNNSFKKRILLEQKVKQKQQKIKQLEGKKAQLTKKYVQKVFEDSLNGGNKIIHKKTNYEQQIKKLLQRQERAEKNKFVAKEVEIWLTRQQQKLNFNFSKKLNSCERIIKILQYLSFQTINFQQKGVMKTQQKPKKTQKIMNRK